MSIRPAAVADLPRLLELEDSFPGDRISAISFRRYIVSPQADVWVAEDEEGGVIGNAIVLYRSGSSSAYLGSLVTDPAHRGRGVGGRLLGFAEACALARGRRRMRLEVRADNQPAIDLYLRSGYRAGTLRPAFYQDGQAALSMVKLLGEGPPAGPEDGPAPRGPRPGRR